MTKNALFSVFSGRNPDFSKPLKITALTKTNVVSMPLIRPRERRVASLLYLYFNTVTERSVCRQPLYRSVSIVE